METFLRKWYLCQKIWGEILQVEENNTKKDSEVCIPISPTGLKFKNEAGKVS